MFPTDCASAVPSSDAFFVTLYRESLIYMATVPIRPTSSRPCVCVLSTSHGFMTRQVIGNLCWPLPSQKREFGARRLAEECSTLEYTNNCAQTALVPDSMILLDLVIFSVRAVSRRGYGSIKSESC